MKASMGFLAVVVSVGSVAGCASMRGESGYTAPKPAPTMLDQDVEYIAAVEEIARRRGTEVKWVNPPTKRPVTTRDPSPTMR